MKEIIQDLAVDVIAIDGGAGAGKGATRYGVARKLGLHELDSGVLYRAVTLISLDNSFTEVGDIINVANHLDISVQGENVFLEGCDRTEEIRSNRISVLTPPVAQILEVREAVRTFQLSMRKAPGLVADGRDMGYIFETQFRFFFRADAKVRARRRMKQYLDAGRVVDYDTILAQIQERDYQDENRAIAPLRPHPEAIIVDTTKMTIEEQVNFVIHEYRKKQAELSRSSQVELISQ